MTSYSANIQGNNLTDIALVSSPTITATATQDEFLINAQGELFYFSDGAKKALYEAVRKADLGTIIKRSFDDQIIDAFVQAVFLGVSKIAITTEITHEEQGQITSAITEKIVIQPIVQPIQTQGTEAPIVWATETTEPGFTEVATYAEMWAMENIAKPLAEKGVKVYNDNVPENEVRPREYVVIAVDDEVVDVWFSGNDSNGVESFCTVIVQGQGNTFNNWVVEIAQFIHEKLRQYRSQGVVRDITNRSYGYDATTETLSRSLSFWLQYNK